MTLRKCHQKSMWLIDNLGRQNIVAYVLKMPTQSSNLEISSRELSKSSSDRIINTMIDELKIGKQLAASDRDVEPRSQWGKQIEFLLCCVGYSVGLGNIWRFPYLCMQYGGGAFLLPYILYLVVCGMSLFFMETAIGQSTGLSTIRIFKMIPFFQAGVRPIIEISSNTTSSTVTASFLSTQITGLGWCMVFASGVVSIYYNLFIAYSLYFLGMSFNWILPWSHCENEWNTPRCFTYQGNVTQRNNAHKFSHLINTTDGESLRSAAEEFWRFNVLEVSANIETIGGINWKILIALTAAWIITFVCMCKGIRTSGKVVYVTATAPYIFLTIILIRGCTLPGAWEGIKLYIVPDWNRLKRIDIWIAAATQIFYSLGPAWGGLITFASYNRYHHDVHFDAIIIPLICGSTSIYGGFAIYSVIGHLMYVTGQTGTTEFVQQGPGLAFVAYPQALTKLPAAAIWSVLFFLMLLTLGLDSQFSTLEAVTTGLTDRFPLIVGRHKTLFTLIVCIVEFLLGFILVTRAGFHYFELLDTYATAFSVVVIGFLETLVIAYLYGARTLLDDVEWMIGPMRKSTRYWWTLTWCVLVPLMTLAIIISTFVTSVTSAKEKLTKFPLWAIISGWTIACLSFVQFPILAGIAIHQHGFNWKKLFLPSSEWRQTVEKRRLACTTMTDTRTAC
ncbi:solute carrier family 6 (neurotransmitter transporter, amino acid) member 5/7/9/14 [Paragonimus westermani]|uniref:Transporter n=1 Tax=Paragonimus westermani TaxID=34504 RepID=A0A5J4NTI1_9TREM|nr:solute carrier family 6 (neurotransmitter transporter, amino acid) member 5/7/9/14 [Paragonimus westermani]